MTAAGAALLVALSVLVLLTLLVEVPLPGGGGIPLGGAVVVALVCLLAFPWGAVVAGVAAAALAVRGPRMVAARTAAGAGAAVGVKAALHFGAPGIFNGGRDALVLGVLAVGLSYFLADAAVAFRRGSRRAAETLTVEVALICAAALVVVGYRVAGAEASLIAAIPLFVTRFSFRRRAAARATYEQTVQALGTLPEVAGFAPLGHSGRTAGYASLLCAGLGLDPAASARVAAACHLHHLGEVSLHQPGAGAGPVDRSQLGAVTEQILQDTGFLAGVAPLVAEVVTADPGSVSLAAAVVRVASSIDDAARRWPQPWGGLVPRGVIEEVRAAHPAGVEAAVAAELASLCEQRPEAVARVAAVRPIGSDLDLHGPDAHAPTAV